MYHFPKYDEEQRREKEEQRKERKRVRRRRRKEKIHKPSWKEKTQQATFPVLVERSKASPPLRHRTRIYFSPEFEAMHSALDSAENSDNEEYYVTRVRPPLPVGSELSHQTRTRKKKKATKVEEELSHSLYPSYLETPSSRNGISFATEAPTRNVDPLPARRSMESMLGLDSTEMQMRLKKLNKLPPIDKENKSQHTDEYPCMKRYWLILAFDFKILNSALL